MAQRFSEGPCGKVWASPAEPSVRLGFADRKINEYMQRKRALLNMRQLCTNDRIEGNGRSTVRRSVLDLGALPEHHAIPCEQGGAQDQRCRLLGAVGELGIASDSTGGQTSTFPVLDLFPVLELFL